MTFSRFHRAATALAFAFSFGLVSFGARAEGVPKFELDASWPKDLPEKWIVGQLGGVCVDKQDNVYVTNRRDITAEEKETSIAAPPIMKFDPSGKLLASWGDPAVVPGGIHGCTIDSAGNMWVTGNNDGIIQKYDSTGKLLIQVGTKGKFDSADGTGKTKGLNAAEQQFYNPAGIQVDPANGDLYVADGYGNRRVVVLDAQGKFLRQFGRQATQGETDEGAGGAFAQVVHCITLSNAGLLYVCDRQGDRVHVFQKDGTFVKNYWIRTGTEKLPDPRGTAWWVGFSPDPEQKFMYVMNGRNEQVHILDHASGKILASFGRPGHQAGNFTHGHTLAVDSKGNIYVAETATGRRVQKFKLVN